MYRFEISFPGVNSEAFQFLQDARRGPGAELFAKGELRWHE
jgi:hypothetical protein